MIAVITPLLLLFIPYLSSPVLVRGVTSYLKVFKRLGSWRLKAAILQAVKYSRTVNMWQLSSITLYSRFLLSDITVCYLACVVGSLGRGHKSDNIGEVQTWEGSR